MGTIIYMMSQLLQYNIWNFQSYSHLVFLMTGVQQGTTFDCSNYGISGGHFDYFFMQRMNHHREGLKIQPFSLQLEALTTMLYHPYFYPACHFSELTTKLSGSVVFIVTTTRKPKQFKFIHKEALQLCNQITSPTHNGVCFSKPAGRAEITC